MRIPLNAPSLGRALYLLARQIVPLALLVVIGLLALHFLYLRNPTRTDTQRLGMDYSIVLEQLHRASTLPKAEIAFFGDSSCLMGIDPLVLERLLAVQPIQSFCLIGFVGPEGYATMLERMIKRGAIPQTLVFMLHPVTFRWNPAWDVWPAFVRNTTEPPPALRFPRSALDFAQLDWLGRALYSPLPGAYGRYYGSESAFRQTMRERNGAAVDPNEGLHTTSLDDVKLVPRAPAEGADYSTNKAFDDALAVLGRAVKLLPAQTRIYLIIAPVAENFFGPASAAERMASAKQMAALLGIDEQNILETPPTMNAAYFSSYTHLDRWGRQAYSQAVSAALSARTAGR
jgi:hypothetical protein